MAPSIEVSNIGLDMARSAACLARFSPVARPMPMTAEPASDMMVRTSAKSTLIRPGVVMRSVMPATPLIRTSSARRKVSVIGASGSPTSSSLSLGITISVSTASSRSSMPCSAWTARRLPSKPKGLVTTPTVRAPTDRATSATTGAPPVPVPPPSPAVMKIMSEPLRTSSSSALCSSAAARPISGWHRPPDPWSLRVRCRA